MVSSAIFAEGALGFGGKDPPGNAFDLVAVGDCVQGGVGGVVGGSLSKSVTLKWPKQMLPKSE